MVGAARCLNLLKIPHEKETQMNQTKEEISQCGKEIESWPKEGTIEFEKVNMRYRPSTDIVLKNLSFKISDGQKIGIVGRTGAGKSTISNVLSRIIEIEGGDITIDGVNIKNLNLDYLRKKITVIP